MDFSQHLRIALHSRQGVQPLDEAALLQLDEAGAFAGRPALRFIVLTAMRGGALQQFLTQGEWNDASREIVERFIAHTGFVPSLAEGVFRAYADACGWKMPAAGARQPADSMQLASEPAAVYGAATAAEAYGNDELSAVRGAMTVDREKEAARGVTVENFNVVSAAGSHVRCTVTLRRLSPMGSGTLTCAVTDALGALVHTATLAVLTVTSPSVMPVSFSIPRLLPAPNSVILRIG